MVMTSHVEPNRLVKSHLSERPGLHASLSLTLHAVGSSVVSGLHEQRVAPVLIDRYLMERALLAYTTVED